MLKLLDDDELEVMTDNKCYRYKTLAEVAEHWEDYEEPKIPYFINWFGEASELLGHLSDIEIEKLRGVGNYFETKEEAEKAVEKLKAWKRLKEAKIDSKLTEEYDKIIQTTHANIIISFNSYPLIGEDLNLLFGGEE